MSGSRFSIFKVKGFNNRKVIKKVIVAGVDAAVKCLKQIDKTKSTDGKSKYGFFEMTLGARCPVSTLIDRFSADAVAFVVEFLIPYDEDSKYIFHFLMRDIDRIINFRENAIVVALYDHRGETENAKAKANHAESDEAKSGETESSEPDQEVEDWIKKIRENHRVATFHVNTGTKEGVEEAYEWLNEQITLDSLNEQITLDTTSQQEAKEQKIKEKTSAYRWLAKLSKAALTFGAHST